MNDNNKEDTVIVTPNHQFIERKKKGIFGEKLAFKFKWKYSPHSLKINKTSKNNC